jgi:hypothetical protein
MRGGRAAAYPWIMNPASDPRRLAGALRFVAELSSVAAECARGDGWNDELTARRKLREEVVAVASPQRSVRKAL